VTLMPIPPWLFGSGKSLIPWARMHCDMRSPAAIACCCCAGLKCPPGIEDLHAWSAAWNWGERGSTPRGSEMLKPPPL
jgi:hypothetical protein